MFKYTGDLKELEKHGFEFNDFHGKYEKATAGYTITHINSWNKEVSVILLSGSMTKDIDIEPLYDLIKAGLVEKED